MSLPWTFATFTTGNHPASNLDDNFQAVAVNTLMPTSASGTNTITLAPLAGVTTLPAYANYMTFSFFAAVTSTGPVTIRVGTLPFLTAYTTDAVTQIGTGAISGGGFYTATYASQLNTGAGGFIVAAGLSTWTATGTGGVARTIASSLQERGISIADYGAIPNDPAQAAINTTALTNACANPNVFIPPGTWYVNGSFVIPNTCKTMYGDGIGVSILRQPDATGVGTPYVFQAPVLGFRLHDLTMRSAYLTNGSAVVLYVVNAVSTAPVYIEDVELNAGVSGLGIDTSSSVSTRSLWISRYTDRGISSNSVCDHISLIDTRVDPVTAGGTPDQAIIFTDPVALEIRGSKISLPGSWGIYINTAGNPAVVPHDIVIVGNQIGTSTVEAIGIGGGYNIIIANNDIAGVTNTSDNGIGIYANNGVGNPALSVASVIVSGNNLKNIGGSGIVINNAGVAQNISITGNVIVNPGFTNRESDGIAIIGLQAGGTTRVTVTGNTVIDQFFAAATDNTIPIAGTGAKTWLGVPAGMVWTAGNSLRIADQANPANYNNGTVTSYSGTTLVMNITSVAGAGTPASWLIGHARSMIAEFTNGDVSGTFTDYNFIEANNTNGGWAGPAALLGYHLEGANSRVTAAGTLIQGRGNTQKGWRTINYAGTSYWDEFLDGSSTLVFRNSNGNTFNVDTSGNISFTGDAYLKGNHFTAAAGAFTWTMPAITGNVLTDNSTASVTGKTYNGLTISTTTGTLTLTNGKTLAVTNSLTLSGTDSTTITFQGTDTYVGRATTDTLTHKTIDGAATGNVITHAGQSALVLVVNRSGNQTPAAGSFVKVQLNNKVTDPNTWFDAVTNFRFQPNVAGVFMVTGSLNMNVGAASYGGIAIYKNGAEYNKFIMDSTTANSWQLSVPAIVSLNGSTDFIELFGFSSGASPLFTAGTEVTKLNIYQLY